MIKKLSICIIGTLFSIYLSAQTVDSDVGYYRVDISVSEETEEKALDSAVKAGALKIFEFIKKDSLFREMFLSAWPEAVLLENQIIQTTDEGIEISVTVKIDRNAILLTEPNYRNAVQSRLNEAELLIVEIEALLQNAGISEENQEVNKASILYAQSDNSLDELKAVLGDISDMSVMSSDGNSTEYFRSRIKGFEAIIRGGQSRMNIVEKEEAENMREQELLSTYRPLKSQLNRLERENNKLEEDSPFYGFTEEQLQDVITRTEAAISTIENELYPKYTNLDNGIPETMESLKARIELDIDRISVLKQHFINMKENAVKEQKIPMAKRSQEKKKKEAHEENIKGRAKWFFFHPPRDRLVFRITPGPTFVDYSWEDSGTDFSLTAEKAFDAGVWGRAKLNNEFRPGYNYDLGFEHPRISGGLKMNHIISSQLALGFWEESLKGIGLEWQWINTFTDFDSYGNDFPIQEPKYYLSAFWGKVDSKRNWPTFLVEYAYGIPSSFNTKDPYVLLNGDITLILRGDDFLLFEAEIWSMPKNHDHASSSDRYLCIEQGLSLSTAIRMPGPFAWGVNFSGIRYASYGSENDDMTEFTDMIWGWGGFFQYSF